MIEWSIHPVQLDLKFTWKISRNASDVKNNLIVRVSDGKHSGLGEAAPNIRYAESPELLTKQFEIFRKQQEENKSKDYQSGDPEFNSDIAYALRFAIDSAWNHFQAARKKINVPKQLGLEMPEHIETAFTIPIMDPAASKIFFIENNLSRFNYIKLKINGSEGYETLKYVSSFTSGKIILDPNESFTDVEELIRFSEKTKKLPIEFLEQPMPAGMDPEYLYLKKYSHHLLFADESIHHDTDFDHLVKMFDGINVKLMKAGSYKTAIQQLKKARSKKMGTMIGCMVESTLGIFSGMNLCSLCHYADLDSFMYVKQEPLKMVEEKEGSLYFLAENTSDDIIGKLILPDSQA